MSVINQAGFSSIHSRIGLRGHSTNTSLPALIKKIREASLLDSAEYDLDVVPLDTSTTFKGHYSGIAITVKKKAGGPMAFYSYLLQATNPTPLQPLTQTVGNETIEIPRCPENAINANTIQSALAAVSAYIGNAATDIMPAGMSIIGPKFSMEDQNALAQYVIRAQVACATFLERISGQEVTYELAATRNLGHEIDIQVESNGINNVALADGTVINAHQRITVISRPKGSGTQQNNNKTLELGGTGGGEVILTLYTTTDFIETAPQYEAAVPGMPPTLSKRCWVPRVHITHIESSTWNGLSLAWMAVYAVTKLVRNKNWAIPYIPGRLENGQVALRDISVLNTVARYYPNTGMFDLRDPSFTMAEMATYLNAIIFDQPHIVLDVHGGVSEHAWLGAFDAAAKGDTVGLQEVKKALDHLVGTNLPLPDAQPVVVNGSKELGAGEVEYAGRFTDSMGRTMPMNALDFCAIGVLSGGDAAQLMAWQETTLPSQLHPTVKAFRRDRLRRIYAPNAETTGFIRMITVPGGVVTPLMAAVESNIPVAVTQVINPLVGTVQSVQMGANMLGYGVNVAAMPQNAGVGGTPYTGAVL